MIKLKSKTINLDNVHNKIYYAISIVAQIYESYGVDLVITSVRDSKHSKKSLHYVGEAFDIRVRNISTDLIKLTRSIQNALGDEFFVLFEGDHIHISYKYKNKIIKNNTYK